VSDHPADNVAAKDVYDYVKVKIGPLDRPLEFGDIPRPNLIGGSGQQFGLGIVGTLNMLSTFFDFAVLLYENPIHRTD
jgi:hypothetical protein